jgi:hypothetical protein
MVRGPAKYNNIGKECRGVHVHFQWQHGAKLAGAVGGCARFGGDRQPALDWDQG